MLEIYQARLFLSIIRKQVSGVGVQVSDERGAAVSR